MLWISRRHVYDKNAYAVKLLFDFGEEITVSTNNLARFSTAIPPHNDAKKIIDEVFSSHGSP